MHFAFLPMLLADRGAYIKAIQFADAGDLDHIERLFAEHIIAMLERGLRAKYYLMNLNGDDL